MTPLPVDPVAALGPVAGAHRDAGADSVRRLLTGWRPAGSGTVEAVLSVRRNLYSSRVSTLVVEVRTSDGLLEQLLLKAGSSRDRTRTGAPWGAAYEATVYHGLLAHLPSFASPYLGHLVDGARVWLVLRWIRGVVQLDKAPHPSGIRSAAAWLGRFHREAAARLDPVAGRRLNRYRDGIVATWAELAAAAVAPLLPAGSAVLRGLRATATEAQSLLGEDETLVHGDLYPPNVLTAGSRVVPVDWEWAGVGAGELDLAALLEGWPEDTRSACVADYRRARWPSGGGQGFDERFAAARLFFAVRWLGGHPVRAGDPAAEYQFGQLVETLRALTGASPGLALPQDSTRGAST